ncbi:cation transporter [Pelistega sp. NLN82]|uniref:Cation transporter n=1 Tax=Pelistega ratti TaxID=2652177 RepID=A0A6L9Y4W5_9BURK|nr:cation diffusion facilitator family transporter [Pelistega ratti]NEN74844.1 cation transporter [Pelistega ratti]
MDTTTSNSINTTIQRQKAASKSTWVSVIVNIFLCVIQIITGYLTTSCALVADAIHSLSDLISDAVVLIANRFANIPPDENHPHGHYRYENIASFFIGLLLLSVGLGMIWNSVHQLLLSEKTPTDIHYAALFIALFVLIAKEGLFRYLLAIGKKVGSTMLIVNAWHARSDALSSLIVFIAIIASIMGVLWADSVAALLVGAMIAHMGLQFTWNALQTLSDLAVSPEEQQEIAKIIQQTKGVIQFHQLKTRKSGDFIHVEVHLEFPEETTIKTAHDIGLAVSHRLKAKGNIIDVTTHFDPISTDHYPLD